MADIHQRVLKSTTSAGVVCDVREVRERRDQKLLAQSSENNEPCSLVLHPMSSRCLSKILVARWESNSLHILGTWRALHRMLKKGQTSHPPNPGAPRRAVPRARPQANRNRRRYRPHFVEPFACTMDLGERENPSSMADIRESQSVR